ncbi:hypothetical protein PACTADRAFT_77848 [Pachysolen tannophilus NRRL Y-2460]|uniref:Thiamine phosphate synthase/TenI domain-containing protein n=1 Tax=Pachysolen tannophilus NRRL Y-2460 TaxID=669874 RepID=A0A1E4TP62_PACTA|nr:hypothetical protein PACTADRAFT_77848 [Pachysolen tannophilus NRRL Y-2460]
MSQFDKAKVDYSLYLVTNREMIPDGITIFEQVERAIMNGVTIVQLREKEAETKEFVEIAKKIHQLTMKYNIPLIINDRVDVALAVDAEGVHIGQDDMDAETVRKLIGDNKILGVSCGYVEDVQNVIKSEAKIDYIGIGAVFPTNTKKLKKVPFGTDGIKKLLTVLRDNGGQHIKSVIIGGLNKSNIAQVLYTSSIPGKATDGVAVVSCIMAQEDALKETKATLACIKEVGPWVKKDQILTDLQLSRDYFTSSKFKDIIYTLKNIKPMVHHITNNVVKNFSANVTISIGGSPIMSELVQEFEDFAQFPNTGLLLNTGTPTEETLPVFLEAVKAYNLNGSPVVYDPVGCGASGARKRYMSEILNHGYFTVIKGNTGEILTAAGFDSRMKGVDVMDSSQSHQYLIDAAKKLAVSQRCVVVLTGELDIIVDGIVDPTIIKIPRNFEPVVAVIKGGHELMGNITGSGCALGSVITAFVASNSTKNVFFSTISAVMLFKEAGYLAGKISDGPGSFMLNFLDQLYKISHLESFKDGNWNTSVSFPL